LIPCNKNSQTYLGLAVRNTKEIFPEAQGFREEVGWRLG
jgi:hypothetical protein